MKRSAFLLPPLLLCFPPLCGRAEAQRLVPMTSRDSAGVQIVDNGALDDRVAFTVGARIYRTGTQPGAYLWQSVGSGSLLPDGRAVIADQGRRQIVVLSPTGAVQTAFGRDGQGPAEFRTPRVAGFLGADTLVISDAGNGRVALYHDGALARTVPSIDGPIRGAPTGMGLVDGTRLAMIPDAYAVIRGGEPGWSSSPIQVLDLATGKISAAGRFDRAPRGSQVTPLSPFGHLAVTNGAIVTNRADRPQIEVTSSSGRPVRLVRWSEAPRPMRDSLWNAYAANVRQTSRGVSAQLEASLRQTRELTKVAPYAGLRIQGDDQGSVWLDEFSAGLPATRFRVFDRTGRWLGWAEIPPRFQILDIAHGRVLGIVRDDLDVQSIALYELRRP